MGKLGNIITVIVAVPLIIYVLSKLAAMFLPSPANQVGAIALYMEGFASWVMAKTVENPLQVGIGTLTGGLTAAKIAMEQLKATRAQASELISNVSAEKDGLIASVTSEKESLMNELTSLKQTSTATISQLQGEVDKLNAEKDVTVTQLQTQLTSLRSQNEALQQAVQNMSASKVVVREVVK